MYIKIDRCRKKYGGKIWLESNEVEAVDIGKNILRKSDK